MVAAIFSTDNPDIVLTSSDDQTMKGWDLNNIKNIKPPNKKRPKTRKKKGTGSDEEEESESYSNTETTLTGNRGPFSAMKDRISKIDEDNISAIDEAEERFQEPNKVPPKTAKTSEKGPETNQHALTLTGEVQKISRGMDDFITPGKGITKKLFEDSGDICDGGMGGDQMEEQGMIMEEIGKGGKDSKIDNELSGKKEEPQFIDEAPLE
jgi:hypothetical protein